MTTTALPLRLLAALATAAALLVGLFVLARAAGSYWLAIGLGAGWMVLCGLVAGKLAKSRPELRWPVRLTTLAVAGAVTAWVFLASVNDKEVNEVVVTGVAATVAAQPAAAAEPAGEPATSGPAEEPAAPAPAQNIEVARGDVRTLAHDSAGVAALVELAEGGRRLTLTNFHTDAGPDLRVYLATDDDAGDFVDLGSLKGNRGNQQYTVPDDVDLKRYDTALVWCRAFSVGFAAADLR
jgi:Electron transfer DM13